MTLDPTFSSDLTEAVRQHYDRLSPLYHRFWGEHIHHGYWQNGESASAAQNHLIEKMVETAGIKPGSRVLDVGCGLGGSSIWLARNLSCTVEGLTISPVQKRMASQRVRALGLTDSIRFRVGDANKMPAVESPFDAVWVVECSEHLDDKRGFFRACYDALDARGTLAVCAWVDKGDSSAGHRQVIRKICEGMVCPSLGRLEEYQAWMREAGFSTVNACDVSARVARTWDLCAKIARRRDVIALTRRLDSRTRRFVEAFSLIQQAYRSGILGYGMFAAVR